VADVSLWRNRLLPPVKRISVAAHESLAILFLVEIFVAITLLVSVIGVLVCIVFFWAKILASVQILPPSLKTIPISCVQGNVRISPPGVRVGVRVSTGQPIRIVAIVQSINVRPHLTAIVTVVISGLIAIAISMLEVIVLTHIPLVTFVSPLEVPSIKIMLETAVSIFAALLQAVPVTMLIAMFLRI